MIPTYCIPSGCGASAPIDYTVRYCRWCGHDTPGYYFNQIERIETPGQPLVFVSGKTGTLKTNDPKQGQFKLKKAVNKHFCNVVIASYSGAYHKVAVMSRNTVYIEGMKTFSWNENHLKPGVRIFEDIRIPETARAFADLLPWLA